MVTVALLVLPVSFANTAMRAFCPWCIVCASALATGVRAARAKVCAARGDRAPNRSASGNEF